MIMKNCNFCTNYTYIMPENSYHSQYNYWGCVLNKEINSCNEFKSYISKEKLNKNTFESEYLGNFELLEDKEEQAR